MSTAIPTTAIPTTARRRGFIAALALALTASVLTASPAGAQAVTCHGAVATITGTPGNDVINGTAGNDVILAGEGDDTINGLGGDDIICGQQGDDFIKGGTGRDRLYGGFGDDQIFGNGSGDRLYGGPGADRNDGGNGADTIDHRASPEGVVVDLLTGRNLGGHAEGDTNVRIEKIAGSQFDDVLRGDAIRNVIIGWGGDDLINGRGGRDTCRRGPAIKNCEVL